MRTPPADTALENKRLRRCMNDLVSVLALPAVWKGSDSSGILNTLVDSLMGMLSLDFLYGRVVLGSGQAPWEVLRIADQDPTLGSSGQIAAILRECLNEGRGQSPVQREPGERGISTFVSRMGIEGELGFIVAGCRRTGFPNQEENLILNVAANQAAISIQQAQLVDEQKRVARELDDRIAERTAELQAVNRELKKEIAERREIERRLLESEAFLLDAQRLSRTGSWKHSFGLDGMKMTPEMKRILGIERHDGPLSAEVLFQAIHPDDRDRERTNYLEAIEGKRGFESEYRVLLADGSVRYIHNSGRPQFDDAGEVIAFTGTAVDLTEQHGIRSALQSALAEIKKSEAKLWQVIDTIPIIAWSNLTDGSNEFLNKKWTEHTGMSFEESHGWGWTTAMHPDDLPVLMEKWQAALISGQADEVEGRFRRRDGVYRWFLIRAEPFRDESGTIVRWYGTSSDIDDRKRAEDELKRSEERYRVVVETASDAVISVDESGVIILANLATKRIFGFDPVDLIGKPLTALMPKAVGQLHLAGFKRNLETGQRHLQSRRNEFTALRASGEEFPVEVSFGEMFSGDQKIFTGFIRDISEKKQAEEAVLASQRKLSLTINTMPVIAWSAQPDGRVDFFNQRWLDYTGLSLPEALDWGWSKAFHPDDTDRVDVYWRAVIVAGVPGEIEARLRRYDGEYRWFLIRGSPLRDESGAVVKWYGTNTDIHDRKQAEEQVRRSEAFLAEAQRLTRVGSFSWRVDTNEIRWSEQLYRIFEFEPNSRVTFDIIATRVHPEDLHLLSDMLVKSQHGASSFEYEHRLLMPDGAVKRLHLAAHGTCDHDGQLEYFGAVQDVTQRQLAEAALAEARSELAKVSRISSLGMLTASIAHEVNQPLSGIITNSSTCLRMLNAEPPNIEGAKETVRRTIRDGNRASDVITGLRTLFKSKAVAAAELVDLNEATREVIVLMRSELQRYEVSLQVELAEELPPFEGDRLQIQQVVLNLLRNASEAMDGIEKKRRLLIKTEQEGDHIRFTVQDSGKGLAPGEAERLFESFYTTKKDGMGIGLSVSRSIIEAHHGRLWATANEGPGATFVFSIPSTNARGSSRGAASMDDAGEAKTDTKVQ